MSRGCEQLLQVLLEGDVNLGESLLGGEFLLGDGRLFRNVLGAIGDDWLDHLLKLFEDGGAGDGSFDGRGVCRSQLSTICIGSVSHRGQGTLGGIGKGRRARSVSCK